MRRNLNESNIQLSLENFKRVLNSGNFQHVCLHGWGEPLLNSQIFQMIKYAESQGISTELTTNGTLLKENLEKIFGSGLSIIALGIHNREIFLFILPQDLLYLVLQLIIVSLLQLKVKLPPALIFQSFA